MERGCSSDLVLLKHGGCTTGPCITEFPLNAAGEKTDASICTWRSGSPELHEIQATQELPFIRGRTVIPDSYPHPVVVGHPNYLGVFEREPSAPLVCLTGRWAALRSVPNDARSLEIAPSHSQIDAASSLENVRRLAKQAKQLAGVHVAFKLQCPILVLLLPQAPSPDHLPDGVEILEGVYRELPGGLRVELSPNMTTEDVTRYAANLERIISEEA